MRIGFIGTASITRNWMAPAFAKVAEAEVVAVLGSCPDRTAGFAADLGIPHADTDIDVFLTRHALDAVYIATTNDRHHEQTLAALEAGVHVLCEKPLSTTQKDAEHMVERAEAASLVLATNHHLRQHGSHRAIRDILRSRELGDIVQGRVSFTEQLPEDLARWRMNDPATGAGVVLDLTVHDIDILRFWMGCDPVRVSGLGKARRGNCILDDVATVWEFENGAVIICQDSFNVPFGGNAVELHGSHGSLIARDVLHQRDEGQITVSTVDGIRTLTQPKRDTYVHVVEDFFASIRTGKLPSCSGADGLASLRYALIAQEAIQSGHAIDIT
ncbi:Gfo/Idh/MocA family protein [Arenibacterium sp. LLYu02]|uniref:Gfo/Idh/MocA family protein n=1 Tax=Arenibacterium sp. LLYu02 TaxID=3404132 RepID=UPI003B2167AA